MGGAVDDVLLQEVPLLRAEGVPYRLHDAGGADGSGVGRRLDPGENIVIQGEEELEVAVPGPYVLENFIFQHGSQVGLRVLMPAKGLKISQGRKKCFLREFL